MASRRPAQKQRRPCSQIPRDIRLPIHRMDQAFINAVRGMFNPFFDDDKKIVSGIYDAAKDAFQAPGRLMQPNPYPAGSEEASWYNDQRQKAMVPAMANIAMMFAGLGSPMAERGAVGAFGGKLLTPTSAASVAEKLDRYLLIRITLRVVRKQSGSNKRLASPEKMLQILQHNWFSMNLRRSEEVSASMESTSTRPST